MVVEMTAIGAVESVVEVVPPVSLSTRAPHHGRYADHSRTYDAAAGPGDHADPPGELCQRLAQRLAEPADVLHRLRVVDRKAAADVEGVERAELRPATGRHELGARLDRLDVLGRVRCLRSDMERQSAHRDAELGRMPCQLEHILRIAAE